MPVMLGLRVPSTSKPFESDAQFLSDRSIFDSALLSSAELWPVARKAESRHQEGRLIRLSFFVSSFLIPPGLFSQGLGFLAPGPSRARACPRSPKPRCSTCWRVTRQKTPLNIQAAQGPPGRPQSRSRTKNINRSHLRCSSISVTT